MNESISWSSTAVGSSTSTPFTDRPFILHNHVTSWPIAHWSLGKLADVFDDFTLNTRFVSRRHRRGSIAWETKTKTIPLKMRELLDWMKSSDDSEIPTDPEFSYVVDAEQLKNIEPNRFWCYAGYQQFEHDQPTSSEFDNAVDWSVFGLPGKTKESTLWIGSAGAYTPCHYDSYGFNIHVQLHGRKRWILFPPTDSENLRPSRLPFEESSVYCHVDLLSAPKCLARCQPFVVVTEPGDAIYVPPHWWHFVQCLTTPCVSVNAWMPSESDVESRVEEAAAQLVASTLFNGTDDARIIDENDIIGADVVSSLSDHTSAMEDLATMWQLRDKYVPCESGSLHSLFVFNYRSKAVELEQCDYAALCDHLKDSVETCKITLLDEILLPSQSGLKRALARALMHPSTTRLLCKLLADDLECSANDILHDEEDECDKSPTSKKRRII